MENKNEMEDAAAMKNEWQQRHEVAENIQNERRDAQQREDGPDTEKYLELEQSGVTFTPESHPTMNSDYIETNDELSDHYKSNGDNSRNADAFSQDDYILRDNIDLDEDQNDSISSDDA